MRTVVFVVVMLTSVSGYRAQSDDVQWIIDDLPTAHAEFHQAIAGSADSAMDQFLEHQLAIARSIRDNECMTALRLLGINENPKAYLLTQAFMMQDGKCLPRNPLAAAQILAHEAGGPLEKYRLARLGALYWKGDGVPKDEDRARQLFRRAAVALGPDLMGWFAGSPSEDEAAAARVWAPTPRHMALDFFDELTGPWDLPPPLKRERDWVLEVERLGAEAMLQIARWLKDGAHGFEKDHPMAFTWLRLAARDHTLLAARRARVDWSYDTTFCAEDRGECRRSWTQVNLDLRRLAQAGDKQAIDILSRCIILAPDYKERNQAIYFWLNERKRRGWAFANDRLRAARRMLSDNEIRILDDWSLATDGPPFTQISEFQCPRG